ncbi:hypothetical protein WH47_06144 [Habropoda laboriosa]|uniref:Secreted peptide n=1 Tax=Habropoda laboriosa TaxID=597456 RepID=A0A0L7RJU2_9HYME|nr:hypothetical protein WH47_06144 [Habropoda laboriosa]
MLALWVLAVDWFCCASLAVTYLGRSGVGGASCATMWLTFVDRTFRSLFVWTIRDRP